MKPRAGNDTPPTSNPASYPIVCVTWRDHHTMADTAWPTIAHLIKDAHEPATCHTVGYLLAQTNDYVLIAQTITEDGTCSEVMKVMCPLLDEIKVLRRVKK
jgi:hypothetical protein